MSLVIALVPFAPVFAQSLTNTATVTAASSVTDGDPANNTASAIVNVTAAATYNFCPATGNILGISGVDVHRRAGDSGAFQAAVPELTDTGLGATLTGSDALMIDPARNRLLYVAKAGGQTLLRAYDGNSGGWYTAATLPDSVDPKAGAMAQDGTGYLVGGGDSPQVWEVKAAPTGTGYTVTSKGQLTFDYPPPDGQAADLAIDANGTAWLQAGTTTYLADLAGSLQARRQAIIVAPILSVPFSGAAFSTDGDLVLFAGGQTAHYAYDPKTGEVTDATDASAPPAASDSASCASPALAPAQLSITKTLGTVNGAPYVAGSPVLPGDQLDYSITVSNSGGIVHALFGEQVQETLPQYTSVVAAANDFTCSGQDCANNDLFNVPAGDDAVLHFVVKVDDPLPAGAGEIDNAVLVSGIDCSAAGNDCAEVTPLGSTVAVAKTSDVGNGTPVQAGDTITYTVTVSVDNAATTAPVVVSDTLGAGLSFGSMLSDGAFGCTQTGSKLTCTLPAASGSGDYPVVYTATVDQDATTSVSNNVTTDTGTCTACATTNPLLPSITVAKSADPASGNTVLPGTTIEYTLTVDIANAATTQALDLVDTLGAGLTFVAVTDAGGFNCTGTLACTLPAGATIGSHAVTYTATVDTDATGSVSNSVAASNPPGGDPDPVCTACTTEHDIVPAEIVVTKSANPAAGTAVLPGAAIEYTLTVTVSNSATSQPLTLKDTLGDGLTFGAVTDAGDFTCVDELTCTLPAGAAVDSHTVTYTATVDTDATVSVANSVAASNPPGGDPDPACATCTIEHKIVPAETTVTKTANPAAGSVVLPGDTIEYTLTVMVANSTTSQAIDLVDTLGTGLTFGAVTDAGAFTCTGTLNCTLPAGTAVGPHSVTYTATVDSDATGSVGNSVTAGNAPNGDPDPVCGACTTEHKIKPVAITVVKSADPAAGSEVRAGDSIAYEVAVTVANSATTEPLDLVDTLGPGLSFGDVTDAGKFACTGTLDCKLPAGTLPGLYKLAYTATVDVDARGRVSNVIAATGGGGDKPDCSSCSVEHVLADPKVTLSKSSNPASGAQVRIGDSIEYTLTAIVENSATLDDVYLADVPGTGLDVASLPDGCTRSGDGFRCALAAGTVPGTYTFDYMATVNADAGATVENLVSGQSKGKQPECGVCETTHKVMDETSLRVSKAVSSRTAKVGDLLRYTLTIENVGVRNFVGGTALDTPPAGFSYVEGSMSVADGDGAFNLAAGQSPLRIDGLDIAVGDKATVVYLLRVGAGASPGVYTNEAVAVGATDEPVSNVATAQVLVESDPLLEDSLVFGTVFDDSDGDGWQDSALLDGVHVQGGFDAGAYIPGTTTIDRGQGPVPVADASAPLLHGIDVGRIGGRESVGDPAAARQVVIRQHLREPAFDDGFVLTSDQGLTLRMDAAGNTSIERSADAKHGIGAGEPVVERRIAHIDGGYEVAYVIGNDGIDERGIPGVRLASVEGLLVETDQYGRYHLVDVQGGEQARGRNFILKVDPATLPAQTAFTTDNPLVRRITPGVPVRFSFGVKLPAQEIPGTTRQLELQLGEVMFAPDSARLREEYLPAIAKMAEQIDAHGGGEVVITAEGGNEALAFARAGAVRDALVAKTDAAAAKALSVALRTRVDDPHSLVAMLGGSETLLGTVLFDTDRSTIRPEFEELLDRVASRLNEMKGGTIGIVGHADVRASHAYNTALGLRRAQAVFDALAGRLSPEVRARLRVESSGDPKAPLGTEQK